MLVRSSLNDGDEAQGDSMKSTAKSDHFFGRIGGSSLVDRASRSATAVARAVGAVFVLSAAAGCSGAVTEDANDDAVDVGESKAPLNLYPGKAITSQHTDALRSGWTNETPTTPLLTTTNVQNSFGKAYTRTIRGASYAQPLYLPQVAGMTGATGTKNVVFVSTMHNRIYAFDADSATANPFWVASLLPSIRIPDAEFSGTIPGTDYRDIWAEVGILSTPVIDQATNTMYVVATSKNVSTSVYRHDIYKVNLTNGSYTSAPVTNGSSDFSKRHSQRSSLLLQDQGGTKVVYFAFGGYADVTPYGGHVFAYRASDLTKLATWQVAGGLNEAGVWMAGQGIYGENGDIYFSTGNGDQSFDSADLDNITKLKLGQSIVRARLNNVNTTPQFQVVSWFSPHNELILSALDGDVGAGGVTGVPGYNYVVSGGKEGVVYVMDKTSMGHYQGSTGPTDLDPNVHQRFRIRPKPATCGALNEHLYIGLTCNHIHGAPVFYKDASNALRMYLWAENDVIRAFTWQLPSMSFNCGAGETCNDSLIMKPPTPTPAGQIDGTQIVGMPGGFLSVSTTGGTSNPIIWATHAAKMAHTNTSNPPDDMDAGASTVDGMLVAYDATNLHELYNSEKNAARDDSGAFTKFVPPTVTGGQVFVPGNNGISNKVVVSTTNTTDRGPAIGTLGSGATGSLVYALKTKASGAGAIKVAGTSLVNNLLTVGAFSTLGYNTQYEPSLVGDGASRIYLAFTDNASGKVKVVRATSSNFATGLQTLTSPSSFEGTNAGPGLAYGNSRVFVAYKESFLGQLRVATLDMSTNPANVTFGNPVTLPEYSDTTPELYYSGTRLYLVWRGTDGQFYVTYSSDNGATWPAGNRKTITYAFGGSGPSMVGLPTSAVGGSQTDLFLFFANGNQFTNQNLSVMTAENSVITTFGYEQRMFSIETTDNPSTTVLNGNAYVAWSDYSSRPWIGRYSPGELVAYGKIP
jgi:hypothetical protein